MKQLQLISQLHHYTLDHSSKPHEVLQQLQSANSTLSNGSWAVAPEQGALLRLLVQTLGAKQVLEVGVFTGYSSCALGLALPHEGRLVALEVDQHYADTARGYWRQAGIEHKVQLMLGLATDSVKQLLQEGRAGSIDLIFVDADKPNYPFYYSSAVELLRPGGLLVMDNTLQGSAGNVLDDGDNEGLRGMRDCNQLAKEDPRTESLMLCIAEGMTISRKL